MAITRPLQKASVVDIHLTKLAQGFKSGDKIADAVFPRLITSQVAGRYVAWDANAFKYRSSARALNARARRNDYDFTIKSFALPDGYTAEFAVDDREDRQTMGVSNLNLPKQKMYLQQGLMDTEREILAAAIATDSTKYTSKANVTNYNSADSAGRKGWARPDTDIYANIMDAKESVCDLIGMYPNKLMVSRAVAKALKLNTSLQKFALNTTPGAAASIPLKTIAEWLELDEILVGKGTYTANDGTRTNIWGTAFAALIYSAPPAGDQPIDPQDAAPSFGWTLQLMGYPKVRKYRDEATTSMVGAIDDNFLHLQTSADAGYFFQTVLG